MLCRTTWWLHAGAAQVTSFQTTQRKVMEAVDERTLAHWNSSVMRKANDRRSTMCRIEDKLSIAINGMKVVDGCLMNNGILFVLDQHEFIRWTDWLSGFQSPTNCGQDRGRQIFWLPLARLQNFHFHPHFPGVLELVLKILLEIICNQV